MHVIIFDGRWHQGGLGAWLESLYRAGFNIADEQLDDDARRKIMRRVQGLHRRRGLRQ